MTNRRLMASVTKFCKKLQFFYFAAIETKATYEIQEKFSIFLYREMDRVRMTPLENRSRKLFTYLLIEELAALYQKMEGRDVFFRAVISKLLKDSMNDLHSAATDKSIAFGTLNSRVNGSVRVNGTVNDSLDSNPDLNLEFRSSLYDELLMAMREKQLDLAELINLRVSVQAEMDSADNNTSDLV